MLTAPILFLRDGTVLSIYVHPGKNENCKTIRYSRFFVHLPESFRSINSCFFLADCELLCVYKEDFDELLKEIMETKHEDIKKAIRRFEYFKNFSDEKVS